MTDLFLRFDDQQHMMTMFTELGLTYTDENDVEHVAQGGHDYAPWEVGEIPNRSGWHVNMRILNTNFDMTALEPYLVFPNQPVCVWA